MRVVVLLENTGLLSSAMRICHGLSLYIETGGISFLLDMGPNAMFAQNAQSLGVDLSQVRFAVVSHGHYDHGGGVDVFSGAMDKHRSIYALLLLHLTTILVNQSVCAVL